MRHRVERRKLGRSSAHREAMLRNMVTSLLEYERIETTLAKAKEVRRVADRMITLAKKGDLHSLRQAMKVIRKKEVAKKLFNDLVIHFNDRSGGYTRILKVGQRPGDNASMAIIELVAKTPKKKPKKKKSTKDQKKSVVQTAREAMAKKPVKKSSSKKKETARKTTSKKSAEKEKKETKSKGTKTAGAKKTTPKARKEKKKGS